MVNVRKRGNVYEYRFDVAKIEGKRKRVSKSRFKTKAEALKQGMIAYNEYLNTGRNIKINEMSYSDFLDYWLDNHCKINLKYHTIEAYSNIVKNHLKPKLGFYKLAQITKTTLQEFLNKVYVEKGYSKNFLNNIRKVLKCSFNYATDNEYVKVNPALNLTLPKYDVPPNDPAHIFTNEEINLILDRFKNNHCVYYAFLTAYCTGLRISEVFALTWDDIDFENKTIRVTKNVYYKRKNKKGRWYLGTTKTENSSRTIHMCDTLCNLLKKYKTEQENNKKEYKENYKYYNLEQIKNKHGKLIEYQIVEGKKSKNNTNMVFVKTNGTYSGADLIKYPFKNIHYELGIKCRFYDLRGSFATTCLRNGCEIKDISKVLGHSKIETTENYYITSTIDTLKNVSETFEKEISLDHVIK